MEEHVVVNPNVGRMSSRRASSDGLYVTLGGGVASSEAIEEVVVYIRPFNPSSGVSPNMDSIVVKDVRGRIPICVVMEMIAENLDSGDYCPRAVLRSCRAMIHVVELRVGYL